MFATNHLLANTNCATSVSLCDDLSSPCAACGTFQYTSPVTNYTYLLNNCGNNTFDVSQTSCNSYGGHLVSYQSSDEQLDAEGYFAALGKFCAP
jgi:hypothetical protein